MSFYNNKFCTTTSIKYVQKKMWFDLMKWVNGLNLFIGVLSKGVYQMNTCTNKIWEQVLDKQSVYVCDFLPPLP